MAIRTQDFSSTTLTISLVCLGISGIVTVLVFLYEQSLVFLWFFAGLPLIMGVFLLIIGWGERRGITTERWTWLIQ